jgi:Sodium/hydrogen exchanger family.
MDWGVAAIWLGLAVLAALISVGLRLSVALTGILVGVAAGALLGKDLLQTNASWVAFLAGVGSVLLTFLAGAELDPETLRRSWKEALGIGLAGFLAPFLGASFLADFTYEGGRGISGAFLGTLGATGLLVGVVSGVGEFLGYAVRLPSGQLGEGRRSWPLLLGYGLNLLASRPGPFSPSDRGGLR